METPVVENAPREREAMPRWVLALLCTGAVIFAAPFLPWVVLSVWLGRYAARLNKRMLPQVRNRMGLSATLTLLAMFAFIIPLSAVIASVVVDAIALVQQLLASPTGDKLLEKLAGGGSTANTQATQQSMFSVDGIMDLARTQGSRAWTIFTQVAGATAHFVIGLLILITGMYGMIVEGPKWRAWMDRVAPMSPSSVKRLADAFVETGRGLAYGIVGAGVIQATVATTTFLILGVPSALALGMLSLLFSVIPAIGTAIVWVPVAAGLALTGREGAAIALAVVGVFVIGSVDNLARPWLARRGELALPAYVLLIAMFGGVELIGGWGLVLGPLSVRLAKEAIAIRSDALRDTTLTAS